MNNTYKLLLNSRIHAWVVASELAKGHKKTKRMAGAGLLLTLLASGMAYADPALNALPAGEVVASGSATFNRTPDNRLIVRQSTDKLITNWSSFDIGGNARAIFVQPNASSIALNRVNSASASQIFGKLDANGQLFIVNPNGVTFGSTAQVNSGALLASSLNIRDNDFLNGNLTFERGTARGQVLNQGSLKAVTGNVTLLSATIQNQKNITSDTGNIFLVNADTARVFDHNVSIVQPVSMISLIRNMGTLTATRLEAHKGQVLLLGDQANDRNKVELRGSINAENIWIKGNDIRVTGALATTGNTTLQASHTVEIAAPVNMNGLQRLFSLSHATGGLSFSGQDKINIADAATQVRINGDFYKVVNDLNQLAAIGTSTATLAARYVLGKDIDASASAAMNAGLGWNPLGTFKGSLHGLGHQLAGLNINRPSEDRVGLFSAMDGAAVQYLNLTGFNVQGNNDVGGLAGFVRSSVVDNVSIQGSVSGNMRVGGLAGYSTASRYERIQTTGFVHGMGSRLGGMLGYNSGGSIEYGVSSSQVTGVNSASIGGLVGYNNNADIFFSYSNATLQRTGTISGSPENGMGGLVGLHNGGTIYYGRSDASITGVGPIGGLVGSNAGVIDHGLSTATLNFSGQLPSAALSGGVGGLVGYNAGAGTIINSQANAQFKAGAGGGFGGGLAGENWGVVDSSSVAWADQAAATPSSIGGLVYFNGSSGIVRNSQSSGNITATGGAAGLVYDNQGTVRDSSSTAVVSALQGGAGGLVNINSATLFNLTSYGNVRGASNVGGAIGINYATEGDTVSNIQAYGKVTGTGSNIGGFVGFNQTNSVMSNNRAYGAVSGVANVGGFVGWNTIRFYGQDPLTGIISEALASGNVSGQTNVGGFVGLNSAYIEYGHASGNAVGVGGTGAAAFAGQNSGTIRGSDASGKASYGFVRLNNNGASIINGIASGLAQEAGFAGANSGLITQSYSYSTGTPMYGFAGSNSSTGVISDSITTANASNAGFAGSNSGQINNSLAMGQVDGTSQNMIAGFVGLNDASGVINDSYATGNVKGRYYVGGLVAENRGSINRSYATGNVNGQRYVGGLVGANTDYHSRYVNYRGVINDSYAHGKVKGIDIVGGLAGLSDGDINRSYASGLVTANTNGGGLAGFGGAGTGVVMQSYWDIDSTGLLSSNGGTGLNSEQMRQASSFVGWDINADPLGTSIWYIDEGTKPPVLR